MTFTSSTGGISISDELDRHFPLFENAVHFRLVVGDKEARYCDLFVRVLSGTRVCVRDTCHDGVCALEWHPKQLIGRTVPFINSLSPVADNWIISPSENPRD